MLVDANWQRAQAMHGPSTSSRRSAGTTKRSREAGDERPAADFLLQLDLWSLLVAPFAEFGFMRRALANCLALSVSAAPMGVFLMLRRMA